MPERLSGSTYLAVGNRLDNRVSPASPEGALDTPPASSPDTDPFQATTESPSDPDALAAAPSSPDAHPSPEDAPTTNSELFYTDVEILGNRYPVRQMISELGNQRMRAVESFTARVKNVLDTPGKLKLGLARSIAESRLNRKQAKFNAVSHLGDKNWLKRHRLRKLQKAQTKFDSADAAYNGRKDRMKNRIEQVGINVEQRRMKYKKELLARREAALSRRALRHELREQKIGTLETHAILKDVPKEHLERIGKLAAVASTSERKATQARKLEKTQEKRETRTWDAINTNRQKAREAAREAKDADTIVEKLQQKTIPKAKESLESLRGELNALDSDDPTRTNLEIQIQSVEERIAIYEEREIPYWNEVARTNRQRVITLDNNLLTLTTNLTQHTAAKRTARAGADAARATAQAHADTLTKAVAEAMDNPPAEN